MPLHLLGKKSWNVYNADNIARVRRDEAAAAAAEEAAEQRMQEVDAARRLAILRGETPPPLPEPEPEQTIDASRGDGSSGSRGHDKKHASGVRKRKRAGEDDTDFEMRLARERAELGDRVRGELVAGAHHSNGGKAEGAKGRDVAIVGRDGHIDLVGPPPPPATGEKNPEYEREAAKKKREMEDQYTMRFSNAAGRDGFAEGDPWYAKSGRRSAATGAATREEVEAEMGMEAPTKNVWGNEDPRRRVREAQRLTSSDPLAMMKMGAKKVREVERDRKREAEEREKELKELKRDEHRGEKRRRRERRDDGVDGHRRHRHRSDRSEHSAGREDKHERDERRHGHRRDHGRQSDRDSGRHRGRDHDSHRQSERHRSRTSRSDRESRD